MDQFGVQEEVVGLAGGQPESVEPVAPPAPPMQVVSLESIAEIVKNAVGGMKEYVDEKIATTKTQVLDSNKTQLKFKGNRIQLEFNEKQSDRVEKAIKRVQSGDTTGAISELKQVQKEFKVRNKHIKLADKSEHGWKVVEEYQAEVLAEDSDDEKKIKSAIKSAAAKSKSTYKPSREASRRANMPYSDPRKRGAETYPNPQSGAANSSNFRRFSRFTPISGPRQSDICFTCGKHGHWRRNCQEWYQAYKTTNSTKTSGATQ